MIGKEPDSEDMSFVCAIFSSSFLNSLFYRQGKNSFMGKSSVTRSTTAATRRCVVTARLHDHPGPVYGIILDEKEGMATVEMEDTHGKKLVLSNVPMNCLDIGDDVDLGYKEGKMMEYRYRYFYVPQKVIKHENDENTAEEENSWRVGQVESVFVDSDGDLMMKFRSRKTDQFLITEAGDFVTRCIPSTKADYILGVGDKSKNMSPPEIRNLVAGCDRQALRRRRRSSEKHMILSPVGEWVHTTVGKEFPEAEDRGPSVASRVNAEESNRHNSESSRTGSKKNQNQPKSRRMRTGPSEERSSGRPHVKHGSSSDIGESEEDVGDNWNGPARATDIEEAGYGNTRTKKNQGSYGSKPWSEDDVNGERRVPLRTSQDRGSSGGRGSGSQGRRSSNQGSGGGPSDRRKDKDTSESKDGGESEGGTSVNQEDKSESSTGGNSKHEYLPRQQARARHEHIFREDKLSVMSGTPGSRLDYILQTERQNTPGFTLGHASALYGFDFGVQPVPIWDIRNAGGGQLRKVEEANTNKAIVSSMKSMESRLTGMSQIINVCYNICSIWGRWYKPLLVEIAMTIDQEMRSVTLVEGLDAPQEIVDAYVALLEGIFNNVSNTLGKVTKQGFNEAMMKEVDQVKLSLCPTSRLHRATVYQAHQKVFGEAFGRKKRGAVRFQDQEEPRKKTPKAGGGGNGAHDTVPSHVVEALKVDGKSLCVGFVLNRGCSRGKDKCRFMHDKLPNDMDQKVMDWIKGQNKKKSE